MGPSTGAYSLGESGPQAVNLAGCAPVRAIQTAVAAAACNLPRFVQIAPMLHINDLTYRIEGRPIFEAATAGIPTGHKVGLWAATVPARRRC